jgi:hypothetical protein
MTDLRSIVEALSKELPSRTSFAFINTRVILRTGVDLHRLDQPVEAARLDMVKRLLREMGFLGALD